MHIGKVWKKSIFVSLMSLGLIFGFSGMGLAAGMSSMPGMSMGSDHSSMGDMDSMDSSVTPVNSEATADNQGGSAMDSDMAGMHGMEEMTESTEAESGHGEESMEMGSGHEAESAAEEGHGSGGGHGSGSSDEGVNWMVVGGFLTINLLVILIAGILKFSAKPNPQI